MSEFYDDNYGHWEDMDGPDMRDFYYETQRRSVQKRCVMCGQSVRIKPEYDKCDSCCRKIEAGHQY